MPISMKTIVSVVLLVVWGVAAGMSLYSIPSSGIGWDVRGDTNEEYYSSNAFGASDLDTAIEESGCSDLPCTYRGLLVQQVGRISYELLTGTAKEDHSPHAIGSIRFQQVFTALLFQAALVAGSIAVFLNTKSRIAAIFFGAFAASIPLLAGHAAMNHKDGAVASGFLLIASAIVTRTTTRSKLATISSHVLLAGGIFVVLGQRPSAIALVLGLAGLDLLAQIVRERQRVASHFISGSGFWGVGLAVALLFLTTTNPYARSGGLSWIVGAALYQSDYPWAGEVRFAGNDYESLNLPLWYIPANFWLQLPTLAALFLVLSGILGVWRLRSLSFQRHASGPTIPILAFSLVVPLAMAFQQIPIYDSIRHVLFLLPLWLLVAVSFTAGIAKRFWLSTRPLTRIGAAVIPAALLASNLYAGSQWFPYQYAYINEFAAQAADRSWETDYWGLSAREGVEALLEEGAAEVVVEPTVGTSWWVGGRPWHHPDVVSLSTEDQLGIWLFARFDLDLDANNCTKIVEIRRAGVLLGFGGLCDSRTKEDYVQ